MMGIGNSYLQYEQLSVRINMTNTEAAMPQLCSCQLGWCYILVPAVTG